MSWTTRVGAVAAGALTLAGVVATQPAHAQPAPRETVPRSASHKILYPTVQAAQHARAQRAPGLASAPSGSGQLYYHGGIDNIGVTTGAPKVYLVVWGSQWGTQGTDAAGNLTFSGDPSNEALILQKLFKGVGTGSEQWSGVMTQYCEGVASGATSCPAGSTHVGYPRGGALAGVWYDNSTTAPTNATDHQIGVEAYAALTHFGNTSAAANRNAQYVVLSPKGTHPGGFNTGFLGPQFCAWHDYNGDTTLNGGAVSSAYGDFAFTNMPYVTDLGISCGANYVNSGTAGAGDGITIVEGHEYAETITDQNPGGGWLDYANPAYENGDKCAWIGVGGTAGAQNVQFGTQGSFPMQATYSNDVSNCQIAHALVGVTTNTVTVTAPSTASSTQAVPITPVSVSAADSDSTAATFTWSATGAPTGVTLASTGATTAQFTGTPTVQGVFSVVVTATDSTGAQGTATISWTVTGNKVTVTAPTSQTTVTTAQYSAATPVALTATDTDGETSFSWSVSGQPAGITVSGSQLVGTPTQSGTFNVKVTARDSTGATGSVTFVWSVTPVTVTVSVTVPSTLTVIHRQPMTPVTATASEVPSVSSSFTWSMTGQPPGVSINSSTGVISGTLGKRTGTYVSTVKATDGYGNVGSATITWTVR